MAYIFNNDILLNEQDRQEAARRYPDIFFALDNPALREAFAPIDARANVSKTRSRRWGVIAVALAVVALTLAAAEVLYHDMGKTVVRTLALIGAVGGIASVVIGLFGVMFRDRKERWLADRLQTERLRQFHFQHIAAHAGLIIKGASDASARDAYLAKRSKDFDTFVKQLTETAEAELHHLVEAEDNGDGLLFPDDAASIDANAPAWTQLLDAYKTLRFDRQIGYCDLILREKGGLWQYAPLKQARLFSGIALTCVMGILVLHGLVFIGAIAEIAWMKGKLVHVSAIVIAIFALAARTLEEGFQPETEVERMRQYRLSLKRIFGRFEEAQTPKDKIAPMMDLEKLSFEEMVLFLRTNHEAQFVM